MIPLIRPKNDMHPVCDVCQEPNDGTSVIILFVSDDIRVPPIALFRRVHGGCVMDEGNLIDVVESFEEALV